MTTTACPVRSLTPEVREVTTWFQRTHTIEMVGPTPVWRQVRLPHAGGLADQDAWLTAALEHVRDIENELLRRRAVSETDLPQIHAEIRRERVH